MRSEPRLTVEFGDDSRVDECRIRRRQVEFRARRPCPASPPGVSAVTEVFLDLSEDRRNRKGEVSVHARVVQASIKPNRVLEFKYAVAHHDLPTIRSQPGFIDDVEMYLSNQFISLTFWQTEEDAERFTSEVFQRIAARSGPLVLRPLRAEAYKTEPDTVHRLRRETVETMEKRAVRKIATTAAA